MTLRNRGAYNSGLITGTGQEMPRITFITPDGERHEIDGENGYTVMETAINNNINGIVAECGGACACAT